MAFKSIEQYNEEKYGDKFILQNDKDYADVIFMYRSVKDVLVADCHYVKSADYSGYVHCNGRGCPACAKGIRVQTKLFIPLYNITAGELQFWDRSARFEPQLHTNVFTHYPNPSEFVFRITREGAAGDINTKYQIIAVGNNNLMSYDEILSKNKITFPDYYEKICKDVDAATLSTWLNSSNAANTSYDSDMPNYVATPRVSPTISPINDFSNIGDIADSDEEVDDVNFD